MSEQHIQQIDALAQRARILPVITIDREADILPMADALAAGGITVLEVTLRTSLGLTAIRQLSEQRPELIVGAGTVLDPETFAQAEEAGAKFIVTPGCTDELLQYAVTRPVPLLPGVATASEIMTAYRHGLRRFKLFPAKVAGGVEALKAFGGPFPDIRFCPTGGVSAKNLAGYLSLPNVICAGGSWMVPSDLGAAGAFAQAAALAREASGLARSIA